MFVRVESRRFGARLKAGPLLAMALSIGACDPELAELLERHGKGGSGAAQGSGGTGAGGAGAVGGSGGQGAVGGGVAGRGGRGGRGGVGGAAGTAGAGGAIQPPLGGVGGGVPDLCAAILCPTGTVCHVQSICTTSFPPSCRPVSAACGKPLPNPPTCDLVGCGIFCEYGNVLDPYGCPTCQCNQPPIEPPIKDPCATVRCQSGHHCEATPVQCVRAPCPPIASCVPDAPEIRCGGFPGVACPGAGTCSDDPSDSCSFTGGGTDCSGICECNVASSCGRGEKFDTSPAVCACVPVGVVDPKPPECPPVCAIFCEFGNVLDANGCGTCTCNPPPKY